MSKETEAKVLKRYRELAGFVKDGKMMNRDKEARAREYVRIQERITEQVKEENQFKENSQYGRLILQANEVQFHLIQLVLLRAFNPDQKFEEELTRAPFGAQIPYLNVCGQSEADVKLINDLRSYKKKRDALAHSMFTPGKLTPSERDNAIKLGNRIIKYIVKNMKDELELRGDEKVFDFPEKFNKLVKRVSSLELRVKKQEERFMIDQSKRRRVKKIK